MPTPRPLTFKVAPHIVEDLGLNLYTSLPRVLVEFVANAYDADSPHAKISFDKAAINSARAAIRKQYNDEVVAAGGSADTIADLESRTLPEGLTIAIEDAGCGMSREELDDKFLVAGRRRRVEEPGSHGRSPGGRPLMGRKGLGKLAGFGVAKVVQVTTRKVGESHATRITLDYDELVKKRSVGDVKIEEERLSRGGAITTSGTTIVLSRLLYDPLKSQIGTIETEIAEHFDLIDPSEFSIKLNLRQIRPKPASFAYAWPEPERPVEEFVDHTLPREAGGEISFRYRLRFTPEGEALDAAKRGVRVYANRRLAAAPSLLMADTNMHGFRMTDYLDGVIHADFVANEKTDYIATDRQSLRWESPLLSGLHDFLSGEIKVACAKYQKLRDDTAPGIVKNDPYTIEQLERFEFSRVDRRMALRIAVILKNACKQGVDDPLYKGKLPIILQGIGHGSILGAISELAVQDKPDLGQLAIEIARLTKDELDQFVGTVKTRIKAIEAFRKVVKAADFKKRAAQNEKVIQRMLEKAPWIIDPTYTQFLTADKSIDVMFSRIASDLKIGEHAPPNAANRKERPDLVFLIGSATLNRLVIVELKSANLPLEEKHRTQLVGYMEQAEEWLKHHNRPMQIYGHLIGSLASTKMRAQGVLALRREIKRAGPQADWKVRDFMEVLTDTDAAHHELLEIHRKIEKEAEADQIDD